MTTASFPFQPAGDQDAPGARSASESDRSPAGAGRVLLLAQGDERGRLASQLAQHVDTLDTADNPFDAISLLWTHRTDALVMRLTDAVDEPDELKDLVDACQRVREGVRVVLLLPRGAMSTLPAWVWQRIDVVLQEPAQPDDLADAIRGDQAPPTAAHDATSTDARAAPGSNGEPEPQSEAATRPEAELGDIDLVDELLKTGRRLKSKALTMVRQQSGLRGIDLAEQRDQVPTRHCQVAVVHEDEVFGYLHAPREVADVETLTPWAVWLSRWLGLEQRYRRLWTMALQDELTGAWNRRYFNRFLARMLKRASRERFQVTVMIFDIDNFKSYNDRYGHAAGDEILRETARLMRSFTREHDVVARVGGDEFGVVFWDAGEPRSGDGQHPMDVEQAVERFRCAIAGHHFPKLAEEARGTLTISAGLASYPWDGRTPERLVRLADEMAIRSKRSGKNALTLGPGALRAQEDAVEADRCARDGRSSDNGS